MRKEIIDRLCELTSEEKKIISGDNTISKELYSSEEEFVIDSAKLLEQGKLIAARPHTRFAHFPVHRHNYIEMLITIQGSITTHIIDGETLTLTEGDILLLNRHARHEILPCSINDIAVNIIILPEFFTRNSVSYDRENILRAFIIESLSEKQHYKDFLIYHAKGILPVENLLENLLWSLLISKTEMNEIIRSSMDLLLMNLTALSADTLKDMRNRSQNVTIQALEYIDRNFKGGTLAELASEIGYSTAYLSRLLKNYTGMNFKQLLQERKLQQAAYLLENTTLSTDRIIEAIGYENSAYFYHIFEEKYGCTPRNYKRRLNNNE
ncbi:AraC family transcriptional regulator [Lachnospiraceae bacterium C1.1]|nr:AraC family transcriptional regulator [Lachnospiraceae bacterium C1.1]